MVDELLQGGAIAESGREHPELASSQSSKSTPSEEFLQIDNELRVTAALAQLPADYQEVIVLRNLQRLSFNEVAERMERSRPAVQMLWMRAIKKLQEEMGDEGSGMKDEG